MSAPSLTTLLDGLTFAEGPRWRDGRLWFSDFYSGKVFAVAPDGAAEAIAEVPARPSGLGWTPSGELLVVSMLDRRLNRLRGGRIEPVAELAALATGLCNDMVVDASGRAYVGNFGYDRRGGEAPRTTCIARVDPDGTVTKAADELLFPNGTVITPDGKTLIVAETFANRLTAFTVDAQGGLSARRVFATLDGVWPDGICLDAEGAVWVADAAGSGVLRVFDGGRVAERIPTAPRKVYACMLGGADRRTLYLCTNTNAGPDWGEKRDGRIEWIVVDVPGAGLP